MSSRSLSGVDALLRVTVAVPVSVATFPIGSAAAAGAGAGVAPGAGVAAGAAAGGVVGAGCACANPVQPDVASGAVGVSLASTGDGIAKTFAVAASMKQPRNQIASGSRCVVTTGS